MDISGIDVKVCKGLSRNSTVLWMLPEMQLLLVLLFSFNTGWDIQGLGSLPSFELDIILH